MPADKLNGGGSEVNGQCLQALLGRLRDAVAFVDRSAGILLTNRVEELSAPPPSVNMAELGETLQIFRPGGQPYHTTEWPVLRAARTGEVILDEEFFRLLLDSTRRSFSCDCAPFYDDQGRISGAVLVAHDVTEQKRAQQHPAYLLPLLHYTEAAVVACDTEWHVTVWNRGAERLFGWTAAEALGRPATFLVLEEKDGSAIEVELVAVAVKDELGHVTGYLGIHRNISERRRAEASLETAAREESLLAELSLRALDTDHLQALLDDAVAVVAEMLGVELSSIEELEPGGEELSWRAAYGWTAAAIAKAPPSPAGKGSLVGYTLMAGKPVISDDVRADERFAVSPTFAEPEPVSAAAVVIPGRRAPFGAFVVAALEQRAFDANQINFVQAVANVVGIAIERAEADERVEAAREAERSRIARDLHDDALAELTDAMGMATSARSIAAEHDDEQRWTTLTTTLQHMGKQLRSAIYDLRLGTHEDRGLADLLVELVQIQAEAAIDCQVELVGHERLPAGSLEHSGSEVLRIVREAITNAGRHSGANLIRVDAGASTAETLRFEISDNGAWPDRESVVSHRPGAGIIGMHERAEILGATLRIEGRSGGGTTLSLELPLAGAGA